MDFQADQVHVFCFPLMAHGHMNPMLDLARLFTQHGANASIITTLGNASVFEKAIARSAHRIRLHTLSFPSSLTGLPEGCDNLGSVTSMSMAAAFLEALPLLQKPFELLVEEHRPTCIISDIFFPWTLDVARKFNIPRLAFSGTSFFSTCALETTRENSQSIPSDEKATFVLPGLPHQVEMIVSQLPKHVRFQSKLAEFFAQVDESNRGSYGYVMNSFCELEEDYVEHLRKKMGRKAWGVGPVSLCNEDIADKVDRGKKASINENECLSWLDSKQESSVVYVCFGSISQHPTAQLHEIALALEASSHPFIWVVRSEASVSDDEWLPREFEARNEGKGLIIRGWAPQILILNHPAVGVFVTHCGWNSILEGVSAGVPMIAWPVFAEQFFNEKLITQVLRIGVGVEARYWVSWAQEEKAIVRRAKIEKALNIVMGGGEEANAMKKRARNFGVMAKKAMEEGGSSYLDMRRLIGELKMRG